LYTVSCYIIRLHYFTVDYYTIKVNYYTNTLCFVTTCGSECQYINPACLNHYTIRVNTVNHPISRTNYWTVNHYSMRVNYYTVNEHTTGVNHYAHTLRFATTCGSEYRVGGSRKTKRSGLCCVRQKF